MATTVRQSLDVLQLDRDRPENFVRNPSERRGARLRWEALREGEQVPYSCEELREKYADPEEQKSLVRLYGISDFMSASILSGRYRVPAALHEPIALSPYGEDACRRLMRVRNLKWPEARLACFLSFYHEELLVDHAQTNLDSLVTALNDEMQAGKVLHPFVWGRELYDRAFELFPHEPLDFDHTDTLRLLDGTPRGVFQQLDLITGPLGILRSKEMRSTPPVVRVPLYHCAKRSCSTVHGTFLVTAESQISKTESKLEEILDKEHGAPSAFYAFFAEIENRLCGYYGDRRSEGELPLLGECFSDAELSVITLEALKGKGAPLRDALLMNDISVRDPQEFINGLDKAAKIQALLLMESRNLTACIDRVIYAGRLEIPEHEIRRPRLVRMTSGFYDLSAECSRYGVRTMPADSSLSLVRLQRLILAIYPSADPVASRELNWHLRRVQGSSPEEKLDRYMAQEDPAEIIRQLVLVGPGSFAIAAEKCGLVSDEVEGMEDSELLNILLWKLGFKYLSSDETSGSLQHHREVFAQAVTAFTGFSEAEKYEIKRESAPLFSSLEKALDSTLSFSAWALTFDHWSAHPRFNYHLSDARAHMANLLNKMPRSASVEPVIYDSRGKNTLFPLISGFSRLRDYLSGIKDEADRHRRPSGELPSYAASAELTPFPFRHTIPFLDLSSDAQTEVMDLLKGFTKTLEEGGVKSVRNMLQHQREEFPSEDELLRCVRAIGNFLDNAEKSGLCPTLFRSTGTSRDSAGRSSFSFRDYRGREYVARRPSGIGQAGMPGLLIDQFIVPVANLNASTDVLRFSIGTRSTYTQLWEDWPKYRVDTDSTRELMRPLGAADAG